MSRVPFRGRAGLVNYFLMLGRGCRQGSTLLRYSPPFGKRYFFPLSWHVVFWLLSCLFCPNSSLFCIYLYSVTSHFSFSSPFLPFSFLFLPFSLTFPPFYLPLFIPFFPKWHQLIFFFPTGMGLGYFQIYTASLLGGGRAARDGHL